MLNEEKRARLAKVLALCEEAAAGLGASTLAPNIAPTAPSPAPSTPLNVVPLAFVGASPTPAPLDVVPLAATGASSTPAPLKGVVAIVSDDEANTTDGLVFKKRRGAVAAISRSSSVRHPASLKDHPPSASSPQSLFALEGGGESIPEPAPTPAPELPLVLQHILKGYQKGAIGSSNEEAVRESLALSFGEFFTQDDAFSHEAESKAKEQLALAEELALVKEQLAQQAQVFFNRETAPNQEISAL